MQLRTELEIKEAHQNLADAFHPRKKYSHFFEVYNDECECVGDCHIWPCLIGSHSSFQGWQTTVMKTIGLSEVCSKQGCENECHQRVYVNIWGCLYELDLCESHAKGVHMTLRDSI